MSVPVRLRMVACLLLLAACGGSNTSTGASPPDGEDPGRATDYRIGHPFPQAQARFGETVLAADLLIAAPGEGVVYLALREGPEAEPVWKIETALGPEGPVSLPVSGLADHAFGISLAVAELDGDSEPELAVGAWERDGGDGGVFLFGVGGLLTDPPMVIASPAGGKFGAGVAFGDFDGDGTTDLAVGAPQALNGGLTAGSAWLFDGPFEAPIAPLLELPNPNPKDSGSYGLHVVADRAPGDPWPTVHIAAPGNDASWGSPSAGQVFSFAGPIEADGWTVSEDPSGLVFDLPRFGMHIAARDGFLVVGAPRKDVGPAFDAGVGFVFDGAQGGVSSHRSDSPGIKDLLGFRVGVGDVIGDESLDFLFVALRPRMVFLWDGDFRGDAPRDFTTLADEGDHFGQGITIKDLVGDPKDEIVLGDPTWDREGFTTTDDVGRVVVYRME
jgi:FG-GAP repeat protein